jgi:AcrR family transcriptional regulator
MTSIRTPRSRPQQRRAEEMRRRLLDTTLRLLARPKPLTTQAIADAAHVSIGTVYRYFNDKQELLDLLLDEAVRDITNDLAASVGRALDQPPEAAVLVIVERLTEAFERHAPILLAFAGADDDLSPEIERTLFPLARVIPARHRPDLTDAQLDDLVFMTMGFTASGCLRIALHRPPTSDRTALIATTARMIAAALIPPGDL